MGAALAWLENFHLLILRISLSLACLGLLGGAAYAAAEAWDHHTGMLDLAAVPARVLAGDGLVLRHIEPAEADALDTPSGPVTPAETEAARAALQSRLGDLAEAATRGRWFWKSDFVAEKSREFLERLEEPRAKLAFAAALQRALQREIEHWQGFNEACAFGADGDACRPSAKKPDTAKILQIPGGLTGSPDDYVIDSTEVEAGAGPEESTHTVWLEFASSNAPPIDGYRGKVLGRCVEDDFEMAFHYAPNTQTQRFEEHAVLRLDSVEPGYWRISDASSLSPGVIEDQLAAMRLYVALCPRTSAPLEIMDRIEKEHVDGIAREYAALGLAIAAKRDRVAAAEALRDEQLMRAGAAFLIFISCVFISVAVMIERDLRAIRERLDQAAK